MREKESACTQPEGRLTPQQAKTAVDRLLAAETTGSELTLMNSIAHINKSYLIRSPASRLAICSVLARCECVRRSAESLAAEWRVHNVAYDLHILRRASGDVDLDFSGDSRWPVALASRLFELLKLF